MSPDKSIPGYEFKRSICCCVKFMENCTFFVYLSLRVIHVLSFVSSATNLNIQGFINVNKNLPFVYTSKNRQNETG